MSHFESSNNNINNHTNNDAQFFSAIMNHPPQNQIEPQALVQDAANTRVAARCGSKPDDAVLFQQLDQELATATASPSNATMAFQLAQKIAPSLLRDPSFRTMFLRACSSDPKRAAQRMIKFFQHKLQLFGVEKLGKSIIAMSDLSDEDRNVLYRGRMQVLKEKDHSGRTVLCTIVQNGETMPDQSSIVSERIVDRIVVVT